MASAPTLEHSFLAGGGEMGALLRAHDWEATPLGSPEGWPQPLRTVVRLTLTSNHPMFVFWGDDLICFYNDAYAKSLGPEKHPAMLGARGRAMWTEIWDIIGPQIDFVMSGQGATWHEDELVPILRHGKIEDVYWTYGFSPIDDEASANGVGGVLVVTIETTGRVVEARQAAARRERLAQLVAQAPGFVAVLRGREQRFDFANPAFAELIGHRDLIGKTVAEALPEAAGQGYTGWLDQAFTSGEAFNANGARYLIPATAETPEIERFVDFVYQPILDSGGEVWGIFVQGSDVTERKRAEEMRVAQNRVLELAVSGAALPEILCELMLAIEAQSSGGVRGSILLLDADGQHLRHGAAPSLPQTYNAAIDGISVGPEVGSCGTAVHRRQPVFVEDIANDPLWRDFRDVALEHGLRACWSMPIVSTQGEMLGTFAMYYGEPRSPNDDDLALVDFIVRSAALAIERDRAETEARRKQEAIALGEQRLKVALAAGGLGTWTLDSTTGDLITSVECRSHYGRGPDDPFTYADLRNSVHPDDQQRMRAAVAQSNKTGDDYDIEYRCVWPDGSVHWVAVNGRVEYDRDGRMARMVGVSQDITERREADEALRNFAAELERRVEERSAENQRMIAQLHEAQKLETLGQLTGGVAHDFNNLLTPIMGTLDLLKRRLGDDDRYATWIENALQSADRARTLVKRLLGFARRTELQRTAVDIVTLIEGMRDLIRSSVGADIAIEIDAAPDLPAALADASQLELALLNLCVNARDAMPAGGVLRLGAHCVAAGQSVPSGLDDCEFILISVADTGAGMDAETLKRAIEPFFSTKDVGRGTGLGLSMVHGLAAQLGGAFELRSTPGRGTEAQLWLQVSQDAVAERVPVAKPLSRAVETEALTVLLVDDESLVRMGTAAMLRELGHRVSEAGSGREALDRMAEGFVPDLVITDYKMPGMDGAELSHRLRALAPQMPILMITGYAGNDETASSLPRLSKPFGQAELAQAVAAVTVRETVAGAA